MRRLFVRSGSGLYNHQFWSGSGYVIVTYLSSIRSTAVASGEAVQVLCSCAGVPNNCHNIVNTSDKLSAVTPLELSTGLRKISRLVTCLNAYLPLCLNRFIFCFDLVSKEMIENSFNVKKEINGNIELKLFGTESPCQS